MIGCIIQTRMRSTRLPGKVLLSIDGKNSVLDYVLNQIQNCKTIQNIVIATTTNKEDSKIVEFAEKNNINYFRGKSKDVLDRYYQCAKKFSFDKIVRITSDCPLIDPNVIDQVVEKFDNGNFDYVSNTLKRTFPIGLDVEIFSFKALEIAWNHANLPSEREHVTPYLKKNQNQFNQFNVEYLRDVSDIRITLDREEDLELIKLIVSKIQKRPILLEDILKLFEKEPNLITINNKISSNEGYEKSLKNDRILKL